MYVMYVVLRWEFIKENKKVRKQENTLWTKKAIKIKKTIRKKTRSPPRKRPRKKEKTFLSFSFGRFFGREHVFFLFFLTFLYSFINSHFWFLLANSVEYLHCYLSAKLGKHQPRFTQIYWIMKPLQKCDDKLLRKLFKASKRFRCNKFPGNARLKLPAKAEPCCWYDGQSNEFGYTNTPAYENSYYQSCDMAYLCILHMFFKDTSDKLSFCFYVLSKIK